MEAASTHKRNQEVSPAEIKLREAAIATILERILSLPQEAKDDLMAVLMEARECNTPEKTSEIEDAVREILYPQLAGELVKGSAGNATRTENLKKRSVWIGAKIKEFREQRGFTQQKLSEATGLPQSHICRLELGQHSPSFATLTKVAKALDVSVGDMDPASD
jgi:DNA-binding XRE family transcriptional regulator